MKEFKSLNADNAIVSKFAKEMLKWRQDKYMFANNAD
jgi:hypothetical protein